MAKNRRILAHQFEQLFALALLALPLYSYAINLGGTEVPKDKFIVYVFNGHSNMIGWNTKKNDTQTHPRGWDFRWWDTKVWRPAKDPLYASRGTMAGPAMPFIKKMIAAYPDYYFGIIMVAKDGSGVRKQRRGCNYWKADGKTDGCRYFQTVDAINAVKAHATIGGILAMHGNSEWANRDNSAFTFADDVKTMVTNIRNDVGLPQLPFLIGECQTEQPYKEDGPYWKEVDKQINSLPGKLSRCAIINSQGPYGGDRIHFTYVGHARWAQKAADVIKAKGWFPKGGQAGAPSAPEISPNGGAFNAPVEVTLTASSGAAIHYTTNGNTPSASSTKYSSPITIDVTKDSPITLKAIAVNAQGSSTVVSAVFTLKQPAVFTELTISPQNPSVAPSATIQFKAQCLDQYGKAISHSAFDWSVSGGGTISKSGLLTAAAETGGPYKATVKATISGKTLTASTSFTISEAIAKVNCGGGKVDDWSAEQYSATGANFTFGGTFDVSGLANPAPNAVYQTVRNESPEYIFPAALCPAGDYFVRLHFSDNRDMNRAMTISIEGKVVESNYNVVTSTGGTNKADILQFDAVVADKNGLSIKIDKGSGNDGFIAGIEVHSGRGTKLRLLTPKSGQRFAVGQTLQITWEAVSNDVDHVVPRISLDAGLTWHDLSSNSIGFGDPGWGKFDWVIPPKLGNASTISSEALVALYAAYGDGGKADLITMDGTFHIDNSAVTRNPLIKSPPLHTFAAHLILPRGRGTRLPVPDNDVTGIALMDCSGRQVYTSAVERFGTNTYDLQHLSPGLYVVLLSAGRQVSLRQVIFVSE